MAFIEFTDKNQINVAEIDAQHRNLFDILNNLHAATVEGREQSSLVEIFNGLIEYTVEHFQAEEDFMEKYQYPEIHAHKEEHNKLTGQALQLQQQFTNGSATISFELLDFLHDWLNEHTMETDMEMGQFLNDKM